MPEHPRKSSLSPAQARLIEWMQTLDFGSIENLTIRGGDPVLDPPPMIYIDVKFGGDNGPRPEVDLKDFVLKKEVQDLLARLNALGNGTICCLEVKHGLPFRMKVRREAR